jgi:hypothetical protein
MVGLKDDASKQIIKKWSRTSPAEVQAYHAVAHREGGRKGVGRTILKQRHGAAELDPPVPFAHDLD